MSDEARSAWNWQWTATFVVMIAIAVSGLLWTRGFELLASTLTVAATLLAMYVIYKG